MASEFDWATIWTRAKPRLGLFLAVFLPIVVITTIYLIRTPREYESTVIVQVELHEQKAFKSTHDQGQDEDLKSDDVIHTIEQNLQNYDLFLKVVSDPKIAGDPNFLVGYPKSDSQPSQAELADWLRLNTKAVLLHGTRLIYISVDHQLPEMAQKLAQALVDDFIAMNDKSQSSIEQGDLKLLASSSEQVKNDLQKSEDALQIYKESLLLKDRIEDQERVIDALKQRYGDEHPTLIQAKDLLQSLLSQFDTEVQKVIAGTGAESNFWATKSVELASAAPDDRIPTELKMVEARAQVLQREVDTESALFDNVLRQMRETDMAQDSSVTDIRVEQAPTLPVKPAKPKKTLIFVLGAVGGSILGIAAIAVANLFDNSIQSPVEAEALLGLPVLGAVPMLPGRGGGTVGGQWHAALSTLRRVMPESLSRFLPVGSAPVDPAPQVRNDDLILLSDPDCAAAESFRSFRVAISMLAKASDQRTVLFTSALASEGKTFVSCNYAFGLAQSGLKTLLVDTDLRRPEVHRRMNIENGVGFAEIILEQISWMSAIRQGVGGKLDVITAGGRCPNPSEALSRCDFSGFIKKALDRYDRVVFDSSPVNLVSDTLLLASSLDRVFLVLRANSTPRKAALLSVTMLQRAQKEPSGIILNALSTDNDRAYRGYKGSHKYGNAYA